jgi:hypothetical protein
MRGQITVTTHHIFVRYGIIYLIAHRTRPVMVNDLVRVSRTVPYECTISYLYGAGNYGVKYGRVPYLRSYGPLTV